MVTLLLIFLSFVTPQEQGKEIFLRRCSGCHAPDIDKEGPRLKGIYGRKSRCQSPAQIFSSAKAKRPIRWDDQSLDRWLTGCPTSQWSRIRIWLSVFVTRMRGEW